MRTLPFRRAIARFFVPDIFAALETAFPHFDAVERVTPDGIKDVGREYLEMMTGWEPTLSEIVFTDQDGKERKLTYEYGDSYECIPSGWFIAETETWGVFDIMEDDAGQPRVSATEERS